MVAMSFGARDEGGLSFRAPERTELKTGIIPGNSSKVIEASAPPE